MSGIEVLRSNVEGFRPRAVTIDADGVLHRGVGLLPGAVDLLARLDRRGIAWRIVTNNSRQSAAGSAAVYRRLGLPVPDTNVETAADAIATFVRRSHTGPGKPRVLMVGDRDFGELLRASGFQLTTDEERAEWVVIGLDRRLTYRKLWRACNAVVKGGRFVTANLDPTVPIEVGAIPGVGAIAAAIATATGITPTNIGKPAPEMMLQAVNAMGATPETSIHLGDRLDSDVMAARNAGMISALVTTGAHTRDDAYAVPEPARPDLIAPDLPTLMDWLDLRE